MISYIWSQVQGTLSNRWRMRSLKRWTCPMPPVLNCEIGTATNAWNFRRLIAWINSLVAVLPGACMACGRLQSQKAIRDLQDNGGEDSLFFRSHRTKVLSDSGVEIDLAHGATARFLARIRNAKNIFAACQKPGRLLEIHFLAKWPSSFVGNQDINVQTTFFGFKLPEYGELTIEGRLRYTGILPKSLNKSRISRN